MTPLGIDPGTVRQAAQRLNHYATPGPVTMSMENISYQELWELIKDSDIVTDFEKKRLDWIRHLARMDHGMLVKKIFESTPEGRRRMGRPRLKWLEDDEKYLQEMKVKR